MGLQGGPEWNCALRALIRLLPCFQRPARGVIHKPLHDQPHRSLRRNEPRPCCMRRVKANRLLQVALAVFFCPCPTGFSQTTNGFFRFVQEQSDRHYTKVPHEVLSTYYGWFVPKSWLPANTNASGIR